MRKALLGLAAFAVAVPALPGAAMAQSHHGYGRYERDYRDGRHDRGRYEYGRYYDRRGYYNGPSWRGRDGRYYCHRSDGTTGLLIGGVAGALVGRSVDTRGDRTAGTLIGGLLGAVIGSSIDKDSGRRCR